MSLSPLDFLMFNDSEAYMKYEQVIYLKSGYQMSALDQTSYKFLAHHSQWLKSFQDCKVVNA